MGDAVDVVRNMAAYLRGATADRVIAALAELQHGVVAYRQLTALGVSRDEIQHRADCGRLHRLHRGVFAVGHAKLTQKAQWMAAVLASGPGAVLSHRSAAALWDLRPQRRGAIEVTVPKERRARKGVRPHVGQLPDDEHTKCDGIPVTTPYRTALDLAAVLEPQHTERLINEIQYRRLIDPLPLAALLSRYPRRAGTPALKAIMAKRALPTDTDMEADYLAFCDEFAPLHRRTRRRQPQDRRTLRQRPRARPAQPGCRLADGPGDADASLRRAHRTRQGPARPHKTRGAVNGAPRTA